MNPCHSTVYSECSRRDEFSMLSALSQNRFFLSMMFLISLIVTFHEPSFAGEMKGKYSIEEEYLRSITFIVDAQTKDRSSEFYSLTHEIFLEHELYRTEFVVSVRSLLDVSAYLDKTKPPLGDAWSRVDIVAHSSEQGLTIPISNNDDKLADFKALKDSVVSKSEIGHIDDSTVITIWACGLGKYTGYLSTLKQFFKGREGSPIVRSPKLNTHFIRDVNSGKASVFFAQEYYLYSSRKIGGELAKEFSYLYGGKVDWLKALNNNETIVDSNSFSEQREMRVKIVVERTLLEEYKTLEELISNMELEDFPLASLKLNVSQFKWVVEDHLQPENVNLVGRSRKVSVFVPTDLVVNEWGRI